MKINGEKIAWAIIELIMIIAIVFTGPPEISNVYGRLIYFIIIIIIGGFVMWRFIENMKEGFK